MASDEGVDEEGTAVPASERTWWNPLHALRALRRMGEQPDPEQPVRAVCQSWTYVGDGSVFLFSAGLPPTVALVWYSLWFALLWGGAAVNAAVSVRCCDSEHAVVLASGRTAAPASQRVQH